MIQESRFTFKWRICGPYNSKIVKKILSSSKKLFDEQKVRGDRKDGVFQIDFTGSYT